MQSTRWSGPAVAPAAGIFGARDFLAIHSAIARLSADAGGVYDPATWTFSPHARPGRPEPYKVVRAFKARDGAIMSNPGERA
jgi:hypothetical protein